MAKEIYVGVSSKARKVSDIYVGVNGIARRVTKGYVGVNGVAQPFYLADKGVYTNFTSSILPTTWNVLSSTSALGNSSFGIWSIESNTTYDEEDPTTYGIHLAFDGDDTTKARSSNYANDYVITITCPPGVTICPKSFSLKLYITGPDDKGNLIQGDGTTLVNMGEDFYDIDEATTKTYTYSGNQYFSKITLRLDANKNNYIRSLYNFSITSGTIRVERPTLAPTSFSTNIFPTSGWDLSADGSFATATNQYGTWRIYTPGGLDPLGDPITNVFDGDTSDTTYWNSASLGAADYGTIVIYCPEGLAINPTQLLWSIKYRGNYTYVRGITVDGTSVNLYAQEGSGSGNSAKTITVTPNTSSYFTSFSISARRYSTGVKYTTMLEFQCTSGTIKSI